MDAGLIARLVRAEARFPGDEAVAGRMAANAHLRTFRTSGNLANMPLRANGKPPSEKRIGSRIRVRPEHADEAAKLFEQNGFSPIYVDCRADGDISFWFGKAPDDEKYRLFCSIPREFYAIQGVVVGDQHPFMPKPANGS